jgi:hypothetical protein
MFHCPTLQTSGACSALQALHGAGPEQRGWREGENEEGRGFGSVLPDCGGELRIRTATDRGF